MKLLSIISLLLSLAAAGQEHPLFTGRVPAGEGGMPAFAYRQMEGDFILTARIKARSPKELGWMVRAGLGIEQPHVTASVNPTGHTFLTNYARPGTATGAMVEDLLFPDVLELERKGDSFMLRAAPFGMPYTQQAMHIPGLPAKVWVGLFAGGKERSDPAAFFRDVRIVTPAKGGAQTVLSSSIEILDPFTGHRQVVYEENRSLQAPNWTVDGKALLYNADGLIYRLDLQKRKPTVVPTGAVKHNNNDHVISFDGKMLGLSSDERDRGGSVLYTVPVTGGAPRLVTPRGPSYLHGWSPDGKQMVFVGMRPGHNHFDIYRVPAAGGTEERLTTAEGLDDGPEYSPDGRYIYFNSNRTGTMLIYRMKPDGSAQEALTDGRFHDWFPHISPDGKWIVFLSFLKEEVASGDHPFYKHVYLRMMPAGGGTPKVIAYLYGGQGTINTPSWSPDSKRLAFVSNGGVRLTK